MDALEVLEAALCAPGGAFSDSAKIIAGATGVGRFCLQILAKGDDELGDLVAELRGEQLLDRVIRHPHVAAEINDQFVARKRGDLTPERRRSFLRLTSEVADRLRDVPEPTRWQPLLLEPAGPDDVDYPLAEKIRALCANQQGNDAVRVVPSGEAGSAAVAAAAAILESSVPTIWHSSRRHTRMLTFIENAPFGSSTMRTLAGITLLDTSLVSDPEAMAEALLHEALHDKLADVCLQLPVLPAGYNDFTAPPLLCPPWRADLAAAGKGWPAWVLLGAAHVYVHLTVLRSRRQTDPADASGPYSTAALRAGYLTESLLQDAVRDAFPPKGREVAQWLRDCFEEVAPVSAG